MILSERYKRRQYKSNLKITSSLEVSIGLFWPPHVNFHEFAWIIPPKKFCDLKTWFLNNKIWSQNVPQCISSKASAKHFLWGIIITTLKIYSVSVCITTCITKQCCFSYMCIFNFYHKFLIKIALILGIIYMTEYPNLHVLKITNNYV